MLRMKASERLSAGACLTEGFELALFNESSTGWGRTMPTGTRAPAGGAQKEKEIPTIIAGTLWDAGRALWNYGDEDDQAGRSASERHSSASKSLQLEVLGTRSNEGVSRPRKKMRETISSRMNGPSRLSTRPPSSPETRFDVVRYEEDIRSTWSANFGDISFLLLLLLFLVVVVVIVVVQIPCQYCPRSILSIARLRCLLGLL